MNSAIQCGISKVEYLHGQVIYITNVKKYHGWKNSGPGVFNLCGMCPLQTYFSILISLQKCQGGIAYTT